MDADLPSHPSQSPRLLAGRYQLLRPLDSGGTGEIFIARDKALGDEQIAVKILRPQQGAGDPKATERFRNEVLLARKLGHPNIVRIYDFGDVGNGYYFITMEYLSGGSLRSFIESQPSGRLRLHDVVVVLLEIAAALEFAHRKDVLHRDVKPENVLISASGELKLCDFGSANSIEIPAGLTGPGFAVGTLDYMAPEQIRGDVLDARTDIYALGMMAYELISGSLPFAADNQLATIAMHLNRTLPDLSQSAVEVPPWLREFVEIAVEKDPRDRWQSMSEVIEVLEKHGSQLIAESSFVFPAARVQAVGRSAHETQGTANVIRALLAKFI